MKKNSSPKKMAKKKKMASLLSRKEAKLKMPQIGDIIKGKIIAIEENAIYLDLGILGTGVVYGQELKLRSEGTKKLKVGDVISGSLVELENEDGFKELSLKEAGEKMTWEDLQEKMKNHEVVKTKILEANKGGLIVKVSGILGFLPVSQLSPEHYPRIEGGDRNRILSELKKFINKEISVRIIDLDKREEKLIVSEKATQDKALKKALANHKLGEVVSGEVTGIVDFGIFIKFGSKEKPLEGLIHISELDWRLIENPHDIVKVGDKVKAEIIKIEEDRVSLSIKKLKKDPWRDIEKAYPKGTIIKGMVTKFNPFGAFVKIDEDIQGLAHISEFKNAERMKKTLELNKEYKFKVLATEPSQHRMALSLINPIREKLSK